MLVAPIRNTGRRKMYAREAPATCQAEAPVLPPYSLGHLQKESREQRACLLRSVRGGLPRLPLALQAVPRAGICASVPQCLPLWHALPATTSRGATGSSVTE